eukprot:8545829-Pyramimonas_sp.AAC.1
MQNYMVTYVAMADRPWRFGQLFSQTETNVGASYIRPMHADRAHYPREQKKRALLWRAGVPTKRGWPPNAPKRN